eukprot:736652-Rhodomonas_salina.1
MQTCSRPLCAGHAHTPPPLPLLPTSPTLFLAECGYDFTAVPPYPLLFYLPSLHYLLCLAHFLAASAKSVGVYESLSQVNRWADCGRMGEVG